MRLFPLGIVLLVLAVPALVAAAPPEAAEQALARALGGPARYRHVQAQGDVVCGEARTVGRPWRPFFAYPRSPAWSVHASNDGLPLGRGLACFDRELQGGRRGAGGPACRAYDFAFYFAYDHFCR